METKICDNDTQSSWNFGSNTMEVFKTKLHSLTRSKSLSVGPQRSKIFLHIKQLKIIVADFYDREKLAPPWKYIWIGNWLELHISINSFRFSHHCTVATRQPLITWPLALLPEKWRLWNKKESFFFRMDWMKAWKLDLNAATETK